MVNKIMVSVHSKRPLSGAAATFVDAKSAAGRAAFPLSDLVKETGLSITAAKSQLLRLGNRVVRPTRKHQFYLIVAPEHRAMGAPPATWWLDDYFKWLGRSYYLALQSAATTYGSAPQALQVTQVMTGEPRREITVGRIRVSFFVKREITKTPTQPMANAFAPLNVSTPEATVFDLIRYAQRIGGIGRAVETLSPLLSLIRVAELKRLLETENETSTAQRLGYVFEKLGKLRLAETVHAWLPSQLPLIPFAFAKRKPINAPIIQKWRVVNNAGESDL
ncbi:MAG TPA: type IV toxin-antitoxin system AbiEi family antitoxin [Verrucomicrobiae bacterium]|nr:type IV toxin-antitoxin system AbiEi family antitoxin [Verrucomicrobiae bacterium]